MIDSSGRRVPAGTIAAPILGSGIGFVIAIGSFGAGYWLLGVIFILIAAGLAVVGAMNGRRAGRG